MKNIMVVNCANWDDAFNAGNIELLVSAYAPNAILLPAGGEPVEGPNAIGEFFADLRAKGLSGHKITIKSILDQDDTQVLTGSWALNGVAPDGSKAQYGGNWVNVAIRKGGAWRILLHTWN